MKTLVIYYSRTGKTKKIAEEIAQRLKADTEEIMDRKHRGGIVGYLSGGMDATTKKLTKIEPVKKEIADYEMVIVGTPVWSATMAPAIRTFLSENILKNAAVFCTCGGMGGERALSDMSKMISGKTVTQMEIRAKDFHAGYDEKLENFIKEIKA